MRQKNLVIWQDFCKSTASGHRTHAVYIPYVNRTKDRRLTTMHVNQVHCRNCGSAVDHNVTECSYCSTPLKISSIKSIAGLSVPIAQKLASSYRVDSDEDDASYALALLFLRLGFFDRSQAALDKALLDDPDSDELYFVQALIALSGKKPFLCVRSAINLAIQSAETAFYIREAGLYKAFIAIVKYDYFFRKGFKVEPTYLEELAASKEIGLASGDLDDLMGLLQFDLPPELLEKLRG